MDDDAWIWLGMFLIASSPFILALALRRFFPRMRHKLICHALSAVLLLSLLGIYVYALHEYRMAGNRDDGSSSMAGITLLAGLAVVVPENLLLYIPWRKNERRGKARPGARDR